MARRKSLSEQAHADLSAALALVGGTFTPDPERVSTADGVVTGDVIDPIHDIEIMRSQVRPNGLGADPNPDMTLSQWLEATAQVESTGRAWEWIMADMLAFGEDKFRGEWSQAITDDLWSRQTLRNMSVIARAIPKDLRRVELPFTFYDPLVSIDDNDVRRSLINSAITEGWTRERMREQCRLYKRELSRVSSASKPVPAIMLPNIEMWRGDATEMPEVADESIHCIITSPPYGLNKHEGDEASEWEDFLWGFLAEAYRVLAPSGRLALNVPIDTTRGGWRPTSSQATSIAINKVGFTYRSTIIWYDKTVNKSVARGSVDSPAAVNIVAPAEHIILFSKGPWKRNAQGQDWDLTREEWLEWTHGVWDVPPESNAWEGHNAAMPLEIPRRLIKLLTFRDDVVLDPFLGSGTTMAASWLLGRHFRGLDVDERWVDGSKRRLAVLTHGPLAGEQATTRTEALGDDPERWVEPAWHDTTLEGTAV